MIVSFLGMLLPSDYNELIRQAIKAVVPRTRSRRPSIVFKSGLSDHDQDDQDDPTQPKTDPDQKQDGEEKPDTDVKTLVENTPAEESRHSAQMSGDAAEAIEQNATALAAVAEFSAKKPVAGSSGASSQQSETKKINQILVSEELLKTILDKSSMTKRVSVFDKLESTEEYHTT